MNLISALFIFTHVWLFVKPGESLLETAFVGEPKILRAPVSKTGLEKSHIKFFGPGRAARSADNDNDDSNSNADATGNGPAYIHENNDENSNTENPTKNNNDTVDIPMGGGTNNNTEVEIVTLPPTLPSTPLNGTNTIIQAFSKLLTTLPLLCLHIHSRLHF